MAFTSSELKKSIEHTLNTEVVDIPDGHKGAMIAHVDVSGVNVVFATKVGNKWQVSSGVQFNPGSNDKFTAGVNIVRTW